MREINRQTDRPAESEIDKHSSTDKKKKKKKRERDEKKIEKEISTSREVVKWLSM